MRSFDNREIKLVLTRNSDIDRITEYLISSNIPLVKELDIELSYIENIAYKMLKYPDKTKYVSIIKVGNISYEEDISMEFYNTIIQSIRENSTKVQTFTKHRLVYSNLAYSNNETKVCIDIIKKNTFKHQFKDIYIVEIEGQLIKLPFKTLVDVTDNYRFSSKVIFEQGLNSGIIIEGGDGAGKTTLIKNMLKCGIVCQDRSIECISNYMFDHIHYKDRVRSIISNLSGTLIDNLVVFVYNTNLKEIENRIKERSRIEKAEISDFDYDGFHYNMMYYEVGLYLEGQSNFIMLDNEKLQQEGMLTTLKTHFYFNWR